jgi:Flp pilus assembly protein TadG
MLIQSLPKLLQFVSLNCAIKRSAKRQKNHVKGHAVIEAALLVPMLIFLFVGAFDMGFYCYDMISVENAVRIAAEYTATSTYTAADSSKACTIALNELASIPNVSGLNSCGSLPLKVSASQITIDGSAATQVSVQYQSALFIPIPGLLTNRLTITRIAQMRLRS